MIERLPSPISLLIIVPFLILLAVSLSYDVESTLVALKVLVVSVGAAIPISFGIFKLCEGKD